jgi:hypothetical protein
MKANETNDQTMDQPTKMNVLRSSFCSLFFDLNHTHYHSLTLYMTRYDVYVMYLYLCISHLVLYGKAARNLCNLHRAFEKNRSIFFG